MDEEITFEKEGIAEDKGRTEDTKERKVVGSCPLCGSDVYEYSWGWGCRKGKECGFSLSRVICEHKITDEEISDLLEKGKTEPITDFVSKEGGFFTASIGYKDKFKFIYPEKGEE